ncbi:MAG: hypothetical protein MJ168_13100 [Clostridia bacterium]|nr:hypothetical protein [Clostridia bacterium]
MAFINEILTKEQKLEFNSWNIKYPFYVDESYLGMKQLLNPCSWTVDKERDIYLMRVYNNREYFYDWMFVFLWNKKTYTVQFHMTLTGNDVVWSIPDHYFHKDLSFPYSFEEHFLDDLRNALKTYGIRGELNRVGNVDCDF